MRRRILTFLMIFGLVFAASLALANIAYTQVKPIIERPTIPITQINIPQNSADQPGKAEQATPPKEPPSPTQDFPDDEIGKLLNQHFNLMVGVGTNAEEKYQESLRELKQKAPEVVPILLNSYLKTDETRYLRRWAIAETLKELQNNAALVALQRIALANIPQERFSDEEHFSVDKEVNIRVNAVDGIAQLAEQGNQEAEDTLTKLFTHPDLTLRRRAIRGYLADVKNKPDEYKRRVRVLESQLPKSDGNLINLDITNIKQVPYPDDIPDNLRAPQKKQDDDAPVVRR